MDRMSLTQIAREIGVTPQYVSQVAKARKRPNWKRAKQLASVTGTTPELWLDGTAEQIKDALKSCCGR